MKKKNILIIRLSSLGDVILVSPVIKKLHDNNYEVDLLIKKQYKDIFIYNPYIKNIIYLEDQKTIFHLIKTIARYKYYRIIDLHNNLRTFFIKIFFFFKTITYKKYRLRRFLMVKFKINLLKHNYVIKNYLNTLNLLNISLKDSDSDYKIFLKPCKKIKIKKNAIIIAPFARYYTKEWPYYNELIKALSKKHPVYIVGEKRESERAQKYHDRAVTNFCGQLNLNEIAYLISKSKLLITNDSGIMHLGAGTETPLISLFGCTTRELGFFPLKNNISIIENNTLNCRPCDFHGRDICPKNHFKCLKDISTEEVLKYAKKFIKV